MRLLLGPAGSGKTFRCLTEVRAALAESSLGPPLVLLAPKQTTYQLERQLLADPAIPGYTRLHILSLERLAYFVFELQRRRPPEMLDEEGRLMVLRGLLAKKRDELKLFRASARLTGFAQQLSLLLRELQRNQLTPDSLNKLAGQVRDVEGLAFKLQDLATLLQYYLDWLKGHNLQDADCLLASAGEVLRNDPRPTVQSPLLDGLWVDGFAEWSPQESELLAALIPHCERATMTFCLDRVATQKTSWLSTWSVVRKSFEQCRKRLESLPGMDLSIELLKRQPGKTRFLASPVLQHFEKFWAEPVHYDSGNTAAEFGGQGFLSLEPPPTFPIRVARCVNPEAEATLAAREILRHVRAGGRYRDVTVLVRKLEGYHGALQRVFAHYEIPFFLDRRESVSHHPLAELTRSALRTIAFQWLRDDWFAALKTGLVPVAEHEIDELENVALARGWKGAAWHARLQINDQPKSPEERERLRHLESRLENLRQRIVPPFQRLALRMATQKPTGSDLAAALDEFWNTLKVEERLQDWAAAEISSSDFRVPNSVHSTVWEQMKAWLENLKLAFPTEALPLREWLPILEAGLANLTVGVIPPALDQVLIGPIDRSRNPDIKLALVLGMNETVFPALPEDTVLLTETERAELAKRDVILGADARQQLARERYYAYIACTRARERLVLTSALQDADGAPLNPSPFLSQVQQLFPSLKFETVPGTLDWRETEHPRELIVPLLKGQSQDPAFRIPQPALDLPALAAVIEQLRQFRNPQLKESLAPELAARLYGPLLRTSVSRMEQFAACPFKFFIHSGLRAEERRFFELDSREQGSFQHDALAYFHQQLRSEDKRWRDITPQEARQRIARIATGLSASYREGLLQVSEQSRFMARVLTRSLEDFVETLVSWMRERYRFDPSQVELAFGHQDDSPAWEIDLGHDRRLALQGRIDRVDLFRNPDSDEALCVVVDYKSSHNQLDPVLMAHGLQLQLLTYLNVVRKWFNPRELFEVGRLVPAGVFYVNLRGKYERSHNRRAALADSQQARKLAYQHTGRFDTRALRQLDDGPGTPPGEQFNYRLTQAGEVNKGSREAMATVDFEALLDSVELNLRKMGKEIFSGAAHIAPYRKGTTTACDQCDYLAICRLDPWTHSFRVLKKVEETA